MMVLTSLLNDSSALKTPGHYPRPTIVRTAAVRDGLLTTASVKRKDAGEYRVLPKQKKHR
jgi:hypothetical protein